MCWVNPPIRTQEKAVEVIEVMQAGKGKKTAFSEWTERKDRVEEAKRLILKLSVGRLMDEAAWREIGCALHAIDRALFDAWVQWSRGASPETSSLKRHRSCLAAWKRFRPRTTVDGAEARHLDSLSFLDEYDCRSLFATPNLTYDALCTCTGRATLFKYPQS